MSRKPPAFEDHPNPFIGGRYRGICTYVVDGDTMDVFLDLGLYQYHYIRVRLQDVNTPEIYGGPSEEELERGRRAREFVEARILDQPVIVSTERDEQSFGRFTARILYYNEEGDWRDLGRALVEAGLAEDITVDPTEEAEHG